MRLMDYRNNIRQTRRQVIMERKAQLQRQASTGILAQLWGRAKKFFGL